MLCTSCQYATNSEFQSEGWLVSVVKLHGEQQWTEYWQKTETTNASCRVGWRVALYKELSTTMPGNNVTNINSLVE